MAKFKFLDSEWEEFDSPTEFVELSSFASCDRDGERFIDGDGNVFEFLQVTTNTFTMLDS